MLTEFKIGVAIGSPQSIRPATANALLTDATWIQAVRGCGTGA
jgi:hypothetical protein